MNGEWRVDKLDRIESRKLSYRGAILLLSMAIVVLPIFLVGKASAAAPVGDDGIITETSMKTGRLADSARLTGLAEHYEDLRESSVSRARAAEAARLTGLADRFLSSGEGDCAMFPLLTRARKAEASRLTGLAEWYMGEELEVAWAPRLNRARMVDARRLTALALHLGFGPEGISPTLACLMGL